MFTALFAAVRTAIGLLTLIRIESTVFRHHIVCTRERNRMMKNLLSCFVIVTASLIGLTATAGEPVIPEIAGKQYLDAFFDGVAKADALEKPLKVVCLGDSNTEGSAYAGPLREILQGCYGDRGIGYHSAEDCRCRARRKSKGKAIGRT